MARSQAVSAARKAGSSARSWRAMAREDEDQLAGAAGGEATARDAGRGLTLSGAVEGGEQNVARGGDESEAMVEGAAGGGEAEGHVGEVELRVRREVVAQLGGLRRERLRALGREHQKLGGALRPRGRGPWR